MTQESLITRTACAAVRSSMDAASLAEAPFQLPNSTRHERCLYVHSMAKQASDKHSALTFKDIQNVTLSHTNSMQLLVRPLHANKAIT
eukprot:3003693-Amphidinium_carterae.1